MLSQFRSYSSVFHHLSDLEILEKIASNTRSKSVCDTSASTYNIAIRRFFSYLDLIHLDIVDLTVSTTTIQRSILPYVSYLFVIEGLRLSTINTYLAGLQHFLITHDILQSTIWSKPLHQLLKGFQYQESVERPMSIRHKLPLTLSIIFNGYNQVISNPTSPFWRSQSLSLWSTSPFVKHSFLAALCFGFMFLLRKSEFLTNSDRIPKITQSRVATIIASNTHFWFGETPCPAHGPFPPTGYPDMMSIYLPISKGDPFGKGATRFFPFRHRQSVVPSPHCI